MESVWNNSARFGSIHQALNRMPHDQIPIGLGFKLRHDPTTCIRCRANIAALELESIIKMHESAEEGTAIES